MSGSFIQELQRRNVFRVAVIYVIAGWVLMQIGDVMFPELRLPEWSITMLVIFLLLGFPLAVILAWAFELTPEGIKRSDDVASGESISASTGRKIDFSIIAVLAVAVIILSAKVWFDGSTKSEAGIPDQSIAVLPFANRSAAAENAEFFAAGLHDELLTLLSKLSNLKVVSRTSVERLDSDLSIPEIGALLGVATVLEGQVQRAGNKLRINVQLIDAKRQDHLWATTYDRELTAQNVFSVQSNIAKTIANSLRLRLSADDDALLDSVPTENTAALEAYLMGRQVLHRNTFDALRQAEQYLRQAVELDPDYAQAWAAIANTRARMLETGMIDTEQYIDVAEPAIARALQLDERQPEAYAEQAHLRWRTDEMVAAETSFQKALALNPTDSVSLAGYGRYLRTTNRLVEAVPVLERALRNDPLSTDILFELGKAEMYSGHPAQNIEYAHRIIEIDPSSQNGPVALVQSYGWMGRYDLMWPWQMKGMAADPEDFELQAHVAAFSNLLGEAGWLISTWHSL